VTGLAIRIGGDVSGLDKAMQRATDIVSTRGKQMVTTALKTGQAMDQAFATYRGIQFAAKHSTALTTGLKGVAVALGTVAVGIGIIKGLEAATAAAAEQVERVAKIGDAARSAGVSNSFYQVWTAQARFLRVENDDLTKSLERLKQAATVSLGEGQEGKTRNESSLTARLRQQVEAGNIGSADLNRYLGANSTEQRLRVLLDLMQQLQSKGRDLAALDIGSQFLTPNIVEGIRNGTIELDRLKQRLNDVKNADVRIYEDSDIENAREMQRRLEEAYRIIRSDLKPIYEDFASAGRDFYGATVSWVESLAGGVRLLAQAYGIMKSIAATAASTPGLTAGNAASNSTAGKAGARVGAIIGGQDVPAEPQSPAAGIAERLGATSPEAVKALQDIAKRMSPTATANDQAKSRAMTDGMFADKSAPIVTTPKTGGGAGAGADTDRTTAVERYVAMLERARDVAKAEADTAGLGNVAREKAVALARAQAAAQQDVKEGLRDSATLTDQERAQIEGAAAATARWKEEAEQTREALDFAKGLAGDALKGFLGDLREGKSLTEALRNALDRMITQISNKLIDMMINSMFGGGGFLGGIGKLFGMGSGLGLTPGAGGLYADGGYTGAGSKYEPAGIVHAGEVVWSQADIRRAGGVATVEAMRKGFRGYANGGFVGDAPALHQPQLPGANSASMQAISILAPITVNGSSGTPEQNDDLAKKMQRQLEVTMRSVVADEMRKQTKPGNFGNTRSR
jgi:hypothetical protein